MRFQFTPAEVCDIVTAATGFRLDVRMLRNWRNRQLLRSYSQETEGASWARYSVADVFQICVMADAIRGGFSTRTAANVAQLARHHAPSRKVTQDSGDLLILPGITTDDDDGEAVFRQAIPAHIDRTPRHEIADGVARMGAFNWHTIAIGRIRDRLRETIESLSEG